MAHTRAAIVSLVAVMAARPIAAQWDLGLELTTMRYRGTVHNTTDSGPPNVRPSDATTVAASVRTLLRGLAGINEAGVLTHVVRALDIISARHPEQTAARRARIGPGVSGPSA